MCDTVRTVLAIKAIGLTAAFNVCSFVMNNVQITAASFGELPLQLTAFMTMNRTTRPAQILGHHDGACNQNVLFLFVS